MKSPVWRWSAFPGPGGFPSLSCTLVASPTTGPAKPSSTLPAAWNPLSSLTEPVSISHKPFPNFFPSLESNQHPLLLTKPKQAPTTAFSPMSRHCGCECSFLVFSIVSGKTTDQLKWNLFYIHQTSFFPLFIYIFICRKVQPLPLIKGKSPGL